MAHPPDIGGYSFNEDDITSCLSSRTLPAKSLSRSLSSNPIYTFSRSPILLFVCLFTLFLPSTHSHVLPPTGRSSDVVNAARPVYQYQSTSRFDTSILENGAALIKKAANTFHPNVLRYVPTHSGIVNPLVKRQATPTTPNAPACTTPTPNELATGEKIGFAIVVIVLVLLSGVFAGLTLGYMSLDETQLQVLMSTGSDIQKARAAKIIPIRKDGHLLLTTLLIANMITNETLPEVFDELLPSKVVSVVISTVLIVIFAELIPQSTCSRYGLQIGAFMAIPTRCIITLLWPVAWPVSRILHWVLGAHHGIVYRRAELKELVTMHAASGGRGGDLKRDTVMIVGGALDLQEKVVKQAMTPIDQVFMLPFTAKLDYATLEKVVRSGHSRIPIYQEIEVEVGGPIKSGTTTPKKRLPLLATFTRKASTDEANVKSGSPRLDSKDQASGQVQGEGDGIKMVTRKKIVGTLLVKSCVLLDPEDAVPVSSMVINALPTVPADEPLLNVLNAFQEGRSHMAIVSPRSRRGMAESVADLGSKSHLYRSSQGTKSSPSTNAAPRVDGLSNIDEEKNAEYVNDLTRSTSNPLSIDESAQSSDKTFKEESPKRRHLWSRAFGKGDSDEKKEQAMPADAIVELSTWESRQSFHSQPINDTGLPIGIITLEDVLEELLGEEILDEYDDRGNEEQDFRNLMPPPSPEHGNKTLDNKEAVEIEGETEEKQVATPAVEPAAPTNNLQGLLPLKKTMLTRLGITRQRSQRDAPSSITTTMTEEPSSSLDERFETISGDATVSASPVPIVGSSDESYFEGATTNQPEQRPRASSTPPIDRHQIEHIRGRSATRPPTPTTITNPTASGQFPPTTPLIYSPQASRAVLIRAHTPGGAAVTTIANESLLRGRQQSLPSQTSALNPSGRSQTPAGGSNVAASNKGNRFKSQAAVGVGGSISTLAPARSRSQAPPTSDSPEDTDDVNEDK